MWSILDLPELRTTGWSERRLVQWLAVWENLNVRDMPGLENSTVIYTIRPRDDGDSNPQYNVETLALTEQQETIDGKKAPWVKIEYIKGKFGWVFGGYTTVERGGPKYTIPEAQLKFSLGWY